MSGLLRSTTRPPIRTQLDVDAKRGHRALDRPEEHFALEIRFEGHSEREQAEGLYVRVERSDD